MTVLSLKQVESNFGKKEPCERDSSWIINFFHCLDFGCRKYGYYYFLNPNSKWLYTLHTQRENLWSEQLFILF